MVAWFGSSGVVVVNEVRSVHIWDILKIELMIFWSGLCVRCERKNHFKIYGLNKMLVPFY